MPKVKIISNPYEKKISYAEYNEKQDAWIPIDAEHNAGSELISAKLIGSFFPFKAKEIVDIIIKEYVAGHDKVEIEFEGTNDEYRELALACEDAADSVVLTKGTVYLENARDILPDIIEIFKSVRDLAYKSVSEQEDLKKKLEKFSDASNNIVPIVVTGNYSTGKSAFINSLIGSEVLPSGTEPLTARVYKIAPSQFADRAAVRFLYGGRQVKILFTADDFRIIHSVSEKAILLDELNEKLSACRSDTIPRRLHAAIEVLNAYDGSKTETKEDDTSDLIEIDVPFYSGVLADSKEAFVVFDTPGSNSASNGKHFQVLHEALQDMSNGLPIYISELDTLDTKDNEALYHELKSMEALDTRFTMIVVNKADTAKLPAGGFSKEKENQILDQSVPRNLYSEGIYFVSSIMGLGSKTDGVFDDEFNAEIYDGQLNKYRDPSSRFYKTLYVYDILPGLMKKHELEDIEKCGNPVYANSGLYTIEKEITTFASKYASYNKCSQSQMFLDDILDKTDRDIAAKEQELGARKESLKKQLDEDKRELIEKMEARSEDQRAEDIAEYQEIGKIEASMQEAFNEGELKKREMELTDYYEKEIGYEDYLTSAKNAQAAVGASLKENFKEAIHAKDKEKWRFLGKDFVSDMKDSLDTEKIRRDMRREVDTKAADTLLEETKDNFKRHCTLASATFEKESQTFWEERTEEMKDALARLVLGSDALDEQKRTEISRLILQYQTINFNNHAEEIFIKEDFERGLRIGNFVLLDTGKLNIHKLAVTYTDELVSEIEQMYDNIRESHENSFDDWMNSLQDFIRDRIVEYNPELYSMSQSIRECEEQIAEMGNRKAQLKEYKKQVIQMMTWKKA